MESLSKSELLMLFCVLEGELEARDLVIDALKVPRTHKINIIVYALYTCEIDRIFLSRTGQFVRALREIWGHFGTISAS